MKIVMYPSVSSNYNQYLNILSKGLLTTGATLVSWAERTSIAGEIDIVFLHWPENKWALKTGPRGWLSRKSFIWRLNKLKKRGAILIWTAHNIYPHSWGGSLSDWIQHSHEFFNVVDGVVYLSEASRTHPAFDFLKHLPSGVVNHPRYEMVKSNVQFAQAGKITRLFMPGALEARKMASSVIDIAVSVLPVVITGMPPNNSAENELIEKVPPDQLKRLTIIKKHLSSESLNKCFDGHTSTLLVQTNILNSGVMFHSLSRGSPIICPRSSTNEAYQKKFGSQWIRIYDHPLNVSQLELLTKNPVPGQLPPLDEHSPEAIGVAAISFFKSLKARGGDSRA